jgi:nucleoside-diphosphate-sugar epimerase
VKAFVTGATGFLGSYLTKELLRQGHEVSALKRPNSDLSLLGDAANQVRWHEGDITDILSLEEAMEGAELVYHAAAMLAFGGNSFQKMLKINVEGTANVVNVALSLGVKKLLYVSSITALGKSKDNSPIDESGDWETAPMESQYGHTKYLGELEIWRGIAEGLDAVIINPSTILGAGRWADGSIQIFHQVARGVPFYPTGSNGFVDVRDVVRVAIMLMDSPATSGERYVINAVNRSFKELMTQIATELGQKPPAIPVTDFWKTISIGYDKVRSLLTGSEAVITREVLSISSHPYTYNDSKLRETLGFSYLPFEQTINETVAAYQQSIADGKEYGVFGDMKAIISSY